MAWTVHIKNMPGCERPNALKIYTDASVGLTTGFGYLECDAEEATVTRRRYAEKVLDADQAEMLAVWVGMEEHKEDDCDIAIYTDRLAIAEKFVEGRIRHNAEVDIWAHIRDRKPGVIRQYWDGWKEAMGNTRRHIDRQLRLSNGMGIKSTWTT